MKKLLTMMFAVLLLQSAASAGIFAGVRGGIGESDNNLDVLFNNNTNYKTSDEKWILGVEAGVEFPGDPFGFSDTKQHFIGFKAAYNTYGKVDGTDYVSNEDFKNEAYTIPLTLYYKYAPEETGVHFWLGGGITYGNLKWSGDDIDDLKDSKYFGHAAAGIEWRIIPLIGVGLDLNYNFDAKIKKDGAYRDFSGLQGFAAVRVYLF
ncbi:Outer membrane protein beta-barrel domain-containing protein [Parelusimicrobium proximum]|uniref:outer membrane beta-barrel protein n=1 Tax=Parelusimicrobium proximum TaxID=3228953 RepID=UPI003D17D523